MQVSHFRDITPTVADRYLREKMKHDAPTLTVPTPEQVGRLQRELEEHRQDRDGYGELAGLGFGPRPRPRNGGRSDLLSSYVRGKTHTAKRAATETERELKKQSKRLTQFRGLQEAYLRQGSATRLSFTIGSNIQRITDTDGFGHALSAVTQELMDYDRYQITQKLETGRLNIQFERASEPLMGWIEQWFLGALSPRQVEGLSPEFQALFQSAPAMLSPREDVKVDGKVKEPKKRLGGWAASSVLSRLDRDSELVQRRGDLKPEHLPAWLGRRVVDDRVTKQPLRLSLLEAGHIYISGKTGSDKSYTGRVMIEEATKFRGVNVLVIDPRNQAAGLAQAEDREDILDLYDNFGMDRTKARGYAFKYHAPALRLGQVRGDDYSFLFKGHHILSLKGLDDTQRCDLYAKVLRAMFHHWSESESRSLRQIVYIGEAHLFTRKRVDERAKDAAIRAENALDTIVREGRKYGIAAWIESQTIRDFSYDAASIRQNTNTKVFLHNSDREVDYAADFLGDGKRIVHLPRGCALIHNPAWGVAQVQVRPPWSKVWEYDPASTRMLLQSHAEDVSDDSTSADGASPGVEQLDDEARHLFETVRENHASGLPAMNLSVAAERSGVTSKRQFLRALDTLESMGLIRTRQLPTRGRPKVIEWVEVSAGSIN